MKLLINTFASISLLAVILLSGCKQSMVISRVDYSQSIESVLEPNENGVVSDKQHGLEFSIMPLQYAETQDTSSVTIEQIRYIRGKEGFYYITAQNFKNVYVMAPEDSKLKLKNKIQVSEKGLTDPALNQRNSYIQLVNRSSGESWRLDADGIQEGEAQMANNEEG